ncbi:MAG: ERCC4 domain-containing protein [Clostridia bacterium]|nr:ERCC4 domain-containing protein [Clostridia bacterium]
MIIVQDTREQAGKKEHILSYLSEHGIRVVRSKLFCGDWTRLDKQDVCIDTKTIGLQEVYGNLIGKQHKRFIDECTRAHDNGIRLIVLVEEEEINSVDEVHTWRNLRRDRWFRLYAMHQKGYALDRKIAPKPPASSDVLEKAMKTVAEKYGVEWRFCKKTETGAQIVGILEGKE